MSAYSANVVLSHINMSLGTTSSKFTRRVFWGGSAAAAVDAMASFLHQIVYREGGRGRLASPPTTRASHLPGLLGNATSAPRRGAPAANVAPRRSHARPRPLHGRLDHAMRLVDRDEDVVLPGGRSRGARRRSAVRPGRFHAPRYTHARQDARVRDCKDARRAGAPGALAGSPQRRRSRARRCGKD